MPRLSKWAIGFWLSMVWQLPAHSWAQPADERAERHLGSSISNSVSARVTPLADGLTVVSLPAEGDAIAVCIAFATDPSELSPAQRDAMLLDLTRRLRVKSAPKGTAVEAQSLSTNRGLIVGDVALMCAAAPPERWPTLLSSTSLRLGIDRPNANDLAIVIESQRQGQLPGFEIRTDDAATRLRQVVTLGPDASVPSLADLASLPLGKNALVTDAIAPPHPAVIAVVGAMGNRDVAEELRRAVGSRWPSSTWAPIANHAGPVASRQRSMRFSRMSAGADAAPSLWMGWIVPGRGDRDRGSFWFMKRLLARRIEVKLARREPAIQVEAGSDWRREDSVFWIEVSNFEPSRSREVEAVLWEQIEELGHRAPGRDEIRSVAAGALDLAKAQGAGPIDRAAALAMDAIDALSWQDPSRRGAPDGARISELARTYLSKSRSTEVLRVSRGVSPRAASPKRRTRHSSAPVRASSSNAGPYRRHRVIAGESLRILARRYHVSLATLIRMNRLERPDRLRPGQIILVPRATPRRASP